MQVPFLDLKAHHEPMREELVSVIQEVIDSNAFAGGPFVAKFEQDFATFCGAANAIGVGNGTDALWLTMLALGIGAGDEVITVPMTFMATAEAISFCGAKPVFVDVDERTYTMDATALSNALSSRTKAIVPVHLFGQVADMNPILKFARQHGLFVIEDAAQAHGAEYKGQKAGSMGEIGCFSFYPGKNLGALGEAGAVVTNNTELRDKIRSLRDHGQVRKYQHTMIGWNCRMDAIQGACLTIELRHLERGNELRRKHAQRYNERFGGLNEVVTPIEADYARHIYHVYAIRVQGREGIIRQLEEKGVGYGVHYPIPMHLQEAYNGLEYERGAFPVSEMIAGEVLSLPMYPELEEDQINFVIETVTEGVNAGVMV